MKSRQPGNKIWSVNRIYHEKYLPENYINNNAGGEASPTPFQKIKIEHISRLSVCNVTQCVFIVCPSRGIPKYIQITVLTTHLLLCPIKLHFLYDFFKINISDIILWLNFIAYLPLLLDILANQCSVIICFPVCYINFEIDHSSLIKPFLTQPRKSGQQFKYLKNKNSF